MLASGMRQASLCVCGLEGHPQSAPSDSDTSQTVLFPGDHAAMWGCLPTCYQSPLRGHCGSPSLHTSAVHACTVLLSSAKPAAKAGTRAGKDNTQDCWALPARPSLRYAAGATGQSWEEDCGWLAGMIKEGMEAHGRRKGTVVLTEKVGGELTPPVERSLPQLLKETTTWRSGAKKSKFCF